MPTSLKKQIATLSLSILFLASFSQSALGTDPSAQAMAYFKQAKYAEAAGAFAKAYATSHSATDCYYTALSYHYGRNSELARKFYLETVQRFPASREASLAQQALATTRPTTTARLNGQDNKSSSYSSPSNSVQSTSANTPTSDPVDDLLAKAAAADQANQTSTADAYYSDAIRNAEKLGQNNAKLIEAINQSANYYARHQRTDKALAAYDRQRNMLQIRYGQDSVQCGNNLLTIARMFKNVDNVEDAKSHYYEAIDTFTNALQDAGNRSGGNASEPRALLAGTLDELADYLYNLVFSAKGYGNVEMKSQHSTDIEVANLRARAQRVRAGN